MKPKVFTSSNGTRQWSLDGKLHREDGPAIIWSTGAKNWYINGLLHREDGPAITWSDKTSFWHLNGKGFFQRIWFEKVVSRNLK